MATQTISIRPAVKSDLGEINRVIESAIMTWNLPDRVKRLSLSSYRYTTFDFQHLDMVVAEDASHNIVGVAAWEEADARDTCSGQAAILLHGIYVQPSCQHHGIGKRLFQVAGQASRVNHYHGLLVKAQIDAEGFFQAMGMKSLPVENEQRDYARRLWKQVDE